MQALRKIHLLIGLALSLAVPASPGAEEDAYCRKVRASANEQAALLTWPRIFAEVDRFPSEANLGPTFGNNIQPRFGGIYSLTDLYRGIKTNGAASGQCELHTASTALQDWIDTSLPRAMLPALEARLAYLDAHHEEWRKILAREEDRMKAGHTTVIELDNLRRVVGILERSLEAQTTERNRIMVELRGVPVSPSTDLAAQVVASTLTVASDAAHLALLDAFQFRVLGGVIPTSSRTDWYARAEVAFNLGAFSAARAGSRYREASDEDSRLSRYQLPTRAATVGEGLRALRAGAGRELEVVEKQLASVESAQAVLQESQATNALYSADNLAIEHVQLESDRIFLHALVQQLPAPH